MGKKIAGRVDASFHQQRGSALSNREREVLNRLCIGGSSKEIAETLFVCEETVRSHLKKIYRKLEVHSKAEAVAKAIRTKMTER